MDEEFQERDSRSRRPATALAGPRKDWPARFEWRKLEWSPDRFTEMGEGIHGSAYRSCGPHIFLWISMVARAFPGRGARGAVDLCNGTWRTAHLRCTSARPCSGGYGWTLRRPESRAAAVGYFQSLRAGSSRERRLGRA